MATQTQQQTTASTDATATQTTAAAAVPSSFSATPPPSEPAPPAEPTQADKAAKMDAITKKMAGEEPAKPAEPEKPKPEAEPAKPTAEPKKDDRYGKLATKRKEEVRRLNARIAELENGFAELASKAKEGEEASEIDKFKMEQFEEQYQALSQEMARAYKEEAQEALGDDFAEVQESSGYYVPLLVKAAPQFATVLAQEENKFIMMRDLFRCFTDGSIDMRKFIALPAPSQIQFLRKMDDLIRNPKPPEATTASPTPPVQTIPTVQPPEVPVPSDSGISAPPDNKNAKMNEIVGRMSKKL